VKGYELIDQGSNPERDRDFSILSIFYTGPETYPSFFPTGTGGSFQEDKKAGAS
jgi:hypothetical protein